MKPKNSFFIILQVVFVLFSLNFLHLAFYKWDGYSFYIRFIDFLPEVSLAYILWTSITVILAILVWLIIIGGYKIISKSIIPIRIEHLIVFFIFTIVPWSIKRTFVGDRFSFSVFLGINPIVVKLIAAILIGIFIWFFT
jgi:hypothetical protein